MPINYFDENVAATYDHDTAELSAPGVVGPVVEFLAALAGDGPALELGIGTGRIALPLRRRGVPVHGIELSPQMVARLRSRAGAEDIGVTMGDFSSATAPGRYRLAYLVFNTIENLTSQEAQVACFRNVASHLEAGGRFLIEVEVPQLQRLPPGERFRPFAVSPEHLGFDEYDVATQGLISHHYRRRDGRMEASSAPFRYVWPAELDLMARLAGMRLVERWGDWDRRPFDSDSPKHVSVWELVADPQL